MLRKLTWRVFVTLAIFFTTVPMTMAEPESLLLDDFSTRDGVSAIGTRWEGFTDRVMGGLSEMTTGYVETDQGTALRMTGPVRLENKGGFIQVRLPLAERGGTLDAGRFDAMAVTVRGKPGSYYLHLRTPDAKRPWQYYRAELPVGAEWSREVIELSRFREKSIETPLDATRLSSIAVVAYGEAFDARVEIARLELVSSAQ